MVKCFLVRGHLSVALTDSSSALFAIILYNLERVNVVIDVQLKHLSLPLLSMIIFVNEVSKVVVRRAEMHFPGKRLKVVNAGFVMFIVQSTAMAIRHVSMVIASFFIWYNDRDNVFLISTLEEQFSIYIFITIVTMTASNFLTSLSSLFFYKK